MDMSEVRRLDQPWNEVVARLLREPDPEGYYQARQWKEDCYRGRTGYCAMSKLAFMLNGREWPTFGARQPDSHPVVQFVLARIPGMTDDHARAIIGLNDSGHRFETIAAICEAGTLPKIDRPVWKTLDSYFFEDLVAKDLAKKKPVPAILKSKPLAFKPVSYYVGPHIWIDEANDLAVPKVIDFDLATT